MITRFGSLFAGHVDLDNLGYDGTPVNDRWLPDEQIATVFDKARAIAELMDRSGYDTFWLAEHHFQREGYECIPNVLMLALHLAHLTTRLKIGCGFNIAPMWHPLRLAEDFATADILTDGRVVFGVGRGYHTREVESFGAPMQDNAANKELFEEQMDVLMKCFDRESWSHHGKHYEIPPAVPYRGYDLKEVTCVPRPIHRPVEIWQPIASGRTLEYIASRGIKGMVTLNGERITEGVAHAYRDAAARAGRQLQLGAITNRSMSLWIVASPRTTEP